jgi:hypothetical protein
MNVRSVANLFFLFFFSGEFYKRGPWTKHGGGESLTYLLFNVTEFAVLPNFLFFFLNREFCLALVTKSFLFLKKNRKKISQFKIIIIKKLNQFCCPVCEVGRNSLWPTKRITRKQSTFLVFILFKIISMNFFFKLQ